MEADNETMKEWRVISTPQQEDPTYYKVTTGLLLTSAILTLAFIQYFKKHKREQRENACSGCQQRPLKESNKMRMVPESWKNIFLKKTVDSPKIGLLQSTYTPSHSEENSPDVGIRLKRKYRTNLALGNKLVDLSKHGYMVTRTKKSRTELGKPVTEIAQTDVPGHSVSLQGNSLNRNPPGKGKRKRSSVNDSRKTAGTENIDPNMCQVELYRDMTRALSNNELSDSSFRCNHRNIVNSPGASCILQHCQGELKSDGGKGIPELQVNGIAYSSKEGVHEMECGCSVQGNEVFDDLEEEEEEEDEGQLQCALKYDQKSATLALRSVSVKTSLDPGIPGFLVEISLLPHNSQTARSKVYVTARREVDITLRETFRLRCTKDDIATNTLSIAVKPMFCSTILYAETDLNELTLISGKEIFLGGYLKSLSHHFN